MRIGLLALVFVVAGCASTGPDAPDPQTAETACIDAFCIDHPGDWDVEVGDGYIEFRHPLAPDVAKATAALINMEAIATAAGGTWPATPEDVSRAFWLLVEEGDGAELATIERIPGGSIRTFGSQAEGRLWHLLLPVESATAVGVEVRGPNSTWEAHADVFFGGVVAN